MKKSRNGNLGSPIESAKKDDQTPSELLKTTSLFEKIQRLRGKAVALRRSARREGEAYDPVEAVTVTGGSRLVAGYGGLILRQVLDEYHADRLDDKANKLTQEITETPSE